MTAIDWRQYDLVKRELADARTVAKYTFDSGRCPLQEALDHTTFESPIEAVFLIWFEYLFLIGGQIGNRAFMSRSQQDVVVDGERFRPDFVIVPSEPLIAAFADLLGCPMKIAVELDGYDFHERTKEQVTLRDRRDRVLQHQGWIVLHISGSELVRTNVEALREVWLCAESQMRRIREAIAKEWGAPLKYNTDVA